jgi:hypothetical protein
MDKSAVRARAKMVMRRAISALLKRDSHPLLLQIARRDICSCIKDCRAQQRFRRLSDTLKDLRLVVVSALHEV